MKNCHLIGVLIIFLCTMGLSSCNYSQKSKLELKFEEYVNKNFADPSDLIEIASIELEDSIDMREFCDLYLNGFYHPDSIENKVNEQLELMVSLAKQVPAWFKYRNREYVMQLWNSEGPYVTLRSEWELLKEEYDKVDSLNLIQKMYVIKARVKQENKTIMKEFYATDYMIVDSVAISDKEILHKDSPQEVLALTDALDAYMNVVRIKMDYLKEIISFNRKQQSSI